VKDIAAQGGAAEGGAVQDSEVESGAAEYRAADLVAVRDRRIAWPTPLSPVARPPGGATSPTFAD
jgi:hypothetical protein